MTAVLWLLVALPALAGGLLATLGVAGPRRSGTPLPEAATITVAAVEVALATAVALGRPAAEAPFLLGAPFALRVDGLSGLLVVVVAVVTLLVTLASLAEVEPARGRFLGLLLLFESAVLLTATASSLLPLLVGWEVMGATSYALIATRWREDRRVGSATTAFLTTRAADLGLYAAAGAALAGGGTLALDALPALPAGWRDLATLGVVTAALGKAAQLPFSFWLARAMDGPSAVSALLHSAAMVAMGGYLLLRVAPLLAASGWGAPTVAWLGAATAVLLGVVALAQTDLKLLLAASTASQLGIVALAAGVGGVAGGTMHLVAHAFVKSTLFLGAGAWLHALGTKDLHGLRGAARRHPAVGAVFVVAGLALAGVPPLSLWATKDEVLAAALERSPALYAAGLLAAVLAAGYAGRAVGVVLRPVPPPAQRRDGTEQAAAGRVPVLAWAPLVPLALAAAVAGVLALPPVAHALRSAVGAGGEPGPGALELAVSALLTTAAFALAARHAEALPARLPAAAGHWWHLEAAAHAVAVRPVLALSRALAALDDRAVDRAVEAAPVAVLAAARRLRRFDERGVDGLVERLAAGARALGAQARRPQTGQLHQYLAQSAAVLVGAVLLLLLVR